VRLISASEKSAKYCGELICVHGEKRKLSEAMRRIAGFATGWP